MVVSKVRRIHTVFGSTYRMIPGIGLLETIKLHIYIQYFVRQQVLRTNYRMIIHTSTGVHTSYNTGGGGVDIFTTLSFYDSHYPIIYLYYSSSSTVVYIATIVVC